MSDSPTPPAQWTTPPAAQAQPVQQQAQPPVSPPGQAPIPPASRRRNNDLAALVLGLVILGVGVYFLLRETLEIALPDIGELWPIFVIILGAAIIYGGLRRRNA